MRQSFVILFLLLLAGSSLLAQTPRFRNFLSATHTATYNTTARFVGGVPNFATFVLDVDNLQPDREYRLYVRSVTNGFSNAAGSPTNLPVNDITFTATGNAANITDTDPEAQPTTLFRATNAALVFNAAATTGNTLIVRFRTSPAPNGGHEVGDDIRIPFSISGLPLVARGNFSNSLIYGPITLTYDLYDFTASASGVFRVSSGTTHRLQIGFQDALGFTVNTNTTTITVNTSAVSPVVQTTNNQFSLISNEPVTLTVNASGTNFTPPASTSPPQNVIPVNSVGIQVAVTNTIGNTINSYVLLNGATPVTLAPAINRFNAVNFITTSYRVNTPAALSSRSVGTYTTTLTYTVTQQ